jgi:hypothetical protein
MSAHRKSAHPQASDHLQHATINPISENSALPKMHEASPSPVTFAEVALGHDFSRVPLHAEVPVQRALSCSLSSTRSPFGGACHTYSVPVQAKLTIGQPDDKDEREADRVADMVMSMPDPRVQRQVGPEEEEEEETVQPKPLAAKITPLLQRQVEPEEEEQQESPIQTKLEGGTWMQRQGEELEEEEEEVIQAKQVRGKAPRGSPGLETQVRSLQNGGQPLPRSVRAFLEPRFGCDFSWVRVHTGNPANDLAQSVNARAFTLGYDIAFEQGQYSPGTREGQRLLAHELAHVAQQRRMPSFIQRDEEANSSENSPASTTSFDFTITPQISWAITALSIRPVREEDTWVCLGGVPENDKPRILMNYFIQYRGNSAFAQIDAQRPANIDRDVYLRAVFEYLWSLIGDDFMAAITDRMRRNPLFRTEVERAMGGYGCGRAPFSRREGEAVV